MAYSTDVERFFKFSCLLLDEGTPLLAKRLKIEVEKGINKNFKTFLHENKHKLFHFWDRNRCCKCDSQYVRFQYSYTGSKFKLSDKEWKELFQDTCRVCDSKKNCICKYEIFPGLDESALDITILAFLLLNCCDLQGGEKQDVINLREKRNSVAHMSRATMDKDTYEKEFFDTSNTIQAIAQRCDIGLLKSVQISIQKIKEAPFSTEMLKHILARLHHFKRTTDEDLEALYTEMKDMESLLEGTDCGLKMKIDQAEKRLEMCADLDLPSEILIERKKKRLQKTFSDLQCLAESGLRQYVEENVSKKDLEAFLSSHRWKLKTSLYQEEYASLYPADGSFSLENITAASMYEIIKGTIGKDWKHWKEQPGDEFSDKFQSVKIIYNNIQSSLCLEQDIQIFSREYFKRSADLKKAIGNLCGDTLKDKLKSIIAEEKKEHVVERKTLKIDVVSKENPDYSIPKSFLHTLRKAFRKVIDIFEENRQKISYGFSNEMEKIVEMVSSSQERQQLLDMVNRNPRDNILSSEDTNKLNSIVVDAVSRMSQTHGTKVEESSDGSIILNIVFFSRSVASTFDVYEFSRDIDMFLFKEELFAIFGLNKNDFFITVEMIFEEEMFPTTPELSKKIKNLILKEMNREKNTLRQKKLDYDRQRLQRCREERHSNKRKAVERLLDTFSPVDTLYKQEWLPKRRKTINDLSNIERNIETCEDEYRRGRENYAGIGALGGVITTFGILASPFTGGASLGVAAGIAMMAGAGIINIGHLTIMLNRAKEYCEQAHRILQYHVPETEQLQRLIMEFKAEVLKIPELQEEQYEGSVEEFCKHRNIDKNKVLNIIRFARSQEENHLHKINNLDSNIKNVANNLKEVLQYFIAVLTLGTIVMSELHGHSEKIKDGREILTEELIELQKYLTEE